MKLGSENRNKLIIALLLMVVAFGLLARWLFSSGGTSSAAVPVTATSLPASPAPIPNRITRSKKGLKAERSLDPTLRLDLLQASEGIQYEGKGRNIFRAEAEIPKPIASARKHAPEIVAPPPPSGPPPPPPIPLKFYGFASRPGEPKKIFLSQGEDVFIAGEGDIVDRRYKVLQISPTAVEVEDVLTNNRQSLPLTQG
jgi:hypothetical protein